MPKHMFRPSRSSQNKMYLAFITTVDGDPLGDHSPRTVYRLRRCAPSSNQVPGRMPGRAQGNPTGESWSLAGGTGRQCSALEKRRSHPR